VILGADFLSKTGIDVKYSTGTIEWFDNELPLREHMLSSKQRLFSYGRNNRNPIRG
jgi:hypothetical protein